MESPLEIWTIIGRPHLARETRGAQDRYFWETRNRPLTNVNNLDKRPEKQFQGKNNDITFRESDAHLIYHPHCNALVITAMMTKNKVHKILVDNGSSVDILYYQAFQKWA